MFPKHLGASLVEVSNELDLSVESCAVHDGVPHCEKGRYSGPPVLLEHCSVYSQDVVTPDHSVLTVLDC